MRRRCGAVRATRGTWHVYTLLGWAAPTHFVLDPVQPNVLGALLLNEVVPAQVLEPCARGARYAGRCGSTLFHEYEMLPRLIIYSLGCIAWILVDCRPMADGSFFRRAFQDLSLLYVTLCAHLYVRTLHQVVGNRSCMNKHQTDG